MPGTRDPNAGTAAPSPANTHRTRHPHAAQAARQAATHNRVSLRIPSVATLDLPPPQHLGWYAGVITLAAIECIEWPIAVILMAGKALADNHHSKTLMEFGEALEETA
jgi:hypothetical protein